MLNKPAEHWRAPSEMERQAKKKTNDNNSSSNNKMIPNNWIRNWGGYKVKERKKKHFLCTKSPSNIVQRKLSIQNLSLSFTRSLSLSLSPHTNRWRTRFYFLWSLPFFYPHKIGERREKIELCWYFMCARCSIPNWRNSIKYLLKVNYVQTVWILFWASCFSLRHFVYFGWIFFCVRFFCYSIGRGTKQAECECIDSNFLSIKMKRMFFFHSLTLPLYLCLFNFVRCLIFSPLFYFVHKFVALPETFHYRIVMWSNAIVFRWLCVSVRVFAAAAGLLMKTVYGRCNFFCCCLFGFFDSLCVCRCLPLEEEPTAFQIAVSITSLSISLHNQTIETLFAFFLVEISLWLWLLFCGVSFFLLVM